MRALRAAHPGGSIAALTIILAGLVQWSAAVPSRAQPLVPHEYATVVPGTIAQDSATSPKSGWLYIVGATTASDYPVTADAYDRTCGTDGRCNERPGQFGIVRLSDVGFTVLDAGGQIRYSTYIGGSGVEDNPHVAVAPDGTVWLSGRTQSIDFPESGCAGSTWIARFAFDFRTLLDVRCIRGALTVADTALDASGRLWLCGITGDSSLTVRNALQPRLAGQLDVFLMQVSADEPQPRLATYIGGSGSEFCSAMAITPSGSVAVVGHTASQNFPVVRAIKPTSAVQVTLDDAFVLVLDGSGQFLQFSTYWGGALYDSADAITVDAAGTLYVGGQTRSPDMPVTAAVIDQRCGSDGVCNGTSGDAFLLKLGPTGALLAATYYGASGLDAARSITTRPGGILVLGTTQSPDFPLVGAPPPARWRPGVNFEHTFLSAVDERLERVTRAEFVADEQYLPNVAVLASSSGQAYVAGQVGPNTGMTGGIGTYVRSIGVR